LILVTVLLLAAYGISVGSLPIQAQPYPNRHIQLLQLKKKIRAKYPNVTVAILTNHDGPEYREAASRSGANYFFTKESVTREEIEDLVKSLAAH
jgi:DNA-binding NarL/FixJ family response regulator